MIKPKEPDFKRPNHPDFLDSAELKRLEFSGIRSNSITMAMEIWVLGELKFQMPAYEIKLYPEKFNIAYADLFGLHHVESVDTGSSSNIILPH